MSDTALTRLKAKYVPAAMRASVYEVVACYIEANLNPIDGLRALSDAAVLRNEPALAETVGEVILASEKDAKLGQTMLAVFDNASPAEIALLKATDAAPDCRAQLLGRAATLARLLK